MNYSILVYWDWFYDNTIWIYLQHPLCLFHFTIDRLEFLHLPNNCVISIILFNIPHLTLCTNLHSLWIQISIRLPECNYFSLFQFINITNNDIIFLISFKYFCMGLFADHLSFCIFNYISLDYYFFILLSLLISFVLISISLLIFPFLFYNRTTWIYDSAILYNDYIVWILFINHITLINLCISINSAINNLYISLIFYYFSLLVFYCLFFNDGFFIYACFELELSFIFSFVFYLLDYIGLVGNFVFGIVLFGDNCVGLSGDYLSLLISYSLFLYHNFLSKLAIL